MALSFCPGWNSHQHIKPEFASFQQAEPEPPEDLLDIYFNFDAVDTSLDQLLEQSNELLQPGNYEDVKPQLSPRPTSESLETISPNLFPTENFDFLHCQKRQKIDEYNFSYLDTSPAFMNGGVLDYCPLKPLQELVPYLPEFPIPPRFSLGHAETVQKPDAGLSAQSIAARQRRRKIAEKLQELGKLVPGGTKMNTAEMLKSAFNYIKFMQAQIGIMELMGPSQEAEKTTNIYELQCLLPSPIIQEKLYSKEKCLVPQEFVHKVASDDNVVDCKASVVKEMGSMMPANNFPSLKGTNFVVD